MKASSKLFIIAIFAVVLAAVIGAALISGGIKSASVSTRVVINEIMLKNSETCPDENDNYYDWIEIYNPSDKEADISGFGLSDSITDPVKYVFPRNTVLDAKGYLVIYCSGNTDEGAYYADFKLSAKDDAVLYDQGGNPIECVELKSVASGYSLARISHEASDFKEQSPTPGFENTEKGIAAYAEFMESRATSAQDVKGDIIINEFMARNATTLKSSDGSYYDWVELYNASDEDMNLEGWYLSDDTENIKKYMLPTDTVIKSHDYLIIFCSGNTQSVSGEIHAPFGLAAYEESVILADPNGSIADKVTYRRQQADISFARNTDGEFEETEKPTPGYPNTQEGYDEFSKLAFLPSSPLYISEVLGSNSDVEIHSGDSTLYCDYIELANDSDEDIDISGYALSDNPTNPAKWTFPQGSSISAGEFLLVLTSSAVDAGSDSYKTNFSVSEDGDTVYLFSPEGIFLDKLGGSTFYSDISYGRNKKKETKLYATPTPGKKNSKKEYTALTSTPEFSIVPGIYDEDSVSVSISCEEGETVYYTTDCTYPTTKDKKYNGEPIEITENTVIRAKTVRDGYYSGFSCISGTYLLTRDDVNHALPCMSLVTTPDNLWDDDDGIYAYGDADLEDDTWPYWQSEANFWKDIEVPAYFEVFSDADGKRVFGQNVGISIAGAFGQGREQKGFAVRARDEYGKDRMSYKFFENLEFTEYKSLTLRCGAQDQANGKIRDVLAAGLLRDSDVNFLYQEYKPYVLYLNGKYWGVYFMREKRCRFFVAQHEGLGLDNSENVTLIKSETRANYGSPKEWADLMDYVRQHGVTNDKHYEYLCERMDIDSFTDYMICEIYVANSDYWNIQMYKTEGGKWKFIYYDFCWGFGNYDHETLKARRDDAQPCSDLFNALLARSDYREKFIRRFAELCDTVFSEERVLALIEDLYGAVQPEMERERSIFNSADSPYFYYVDPQNYSSYDTFEFHIEDIKSFATHRRDEIIEDLKQEFRAERSLIEEVFSDG